MPIRRQGLSGGAQGGLDAIARFLALLANNRMVSDRQMEYGEQVAARQEASENRRFEQQKQMAEAQARAEAAQAEQKRRQDVALMIAKGELTPQQGMMLLRGEGDIGDLAPQQSFTGITGIGAQDAAGMNLVDRQRALQASRPGMERGEMQGILGQPQEATLARSVPDIKARSDYQAVQQQRAREQGVRDRLAELDPRIVSAEVSRAGTIAGAQREPDKTPEQIAAEERARVDARYGVEEERGVGAYAPEEPSTLATRMPVIEEAANTLNELEQNLGGFDWLSSFGLAPTIPNAFRSEYVQRYNQAINNIVAIAVEEINTGNPTDKDVERLTNILKVEAGDGAAAIAQKSQTVKTLVNSLRQGAGLEPYRQFLMGGSEPTPGPQQGRYRIDSVTPGGGR